MIRLKSIGSLWNTMLKLSLKIALRPNKRFFFTFLGVAVCMMYVAGTTSLIAGLGEGGKGFLDSEERYYICYPEDSLLSPKPYGELVGDCSGQCLLGVVAEVFLNGSSTYLVGFVGVGDEESDLVIDPGDGVLIGPLVYPGFLEENITFSSMDKMHTFSVIGRLESSFLPPDWIVASPEAVWSVGGYQEDLFSFFLTQEPGDSEKNGLLVMPLSSGSEFFTAGLEQVTENLWVLSSVAGLVAVLVVYNLMRVEVLARKEDIQVLEGIGGSRLWIWSVFSFEVLAASFFGGFLGVVLGILGANLIISAFTLLGYTVLITPHIDAGYVIFPVLIAVVAGLFGGGIASYHGLSSARGGD